VPVPSKCIDETRIVKLIGVAAQLLIATGSQMVAGRPPHSAVTVTGGGAAASVQVALGDDLEVRLDANPTTGYVWRYRVAEPAKLHLKTQHFQRSAGADAMRLGAGGAQLFVFEAVAVGAERLHFEYRRGQTGAPLRTYVLTVRVTP
jgi:inhibitor of cysteine peptidase